MMGRGLTNMEGEDFLALKAGAEVLEADQYGEKVLRLTDGRLLKLFRRKRLISSAMWRPYALRFVNNAQALSLRGIPVPQVIAALRVPSVERDAVLYQPLEGTTLRDLVEHRLDAQNEESIKKLFTNFVIHLHDLGIYFRSLHLGNVVLTPAGELGLIDFSDLRIYRRPLPLFMRRRNIRRMLGMPKECAWIDSAAILHPQTP
jgi:RIO-like serine/threonine protein kinase